MNTDLQTMQILYETYARLRRDRAEMPAVDEDGLRDLIGDLKDGELLTVIPVSAEGRDEK